MDLLIAATLHAHGTWPSSRNPADLAGLHEQLAVVKVRTISPPESDLDTAHAAEWVTFRRPPEHVQSDSGRSEGCRKHLAPVMTDPRQRCRASVAALNAAEEDVLPSTC